MSLAESKKPSLVSIIIPVYNRAHLIGETLDSILNQTYVNWECLVVDDGSTDDTLKLLSIYCKKDSRIQSYKRDSSKLKGANVCRNIGVKKAKGDYIVFFDSDDLMTPDHLHTKITAIKKYNKDYVITRTEYFNADNSKLNKNYSFSNDDITASNYITKKINWLTLDVMINTTLGQSIQFNEHLKSGQEYNYFCKLVLKSINTCFIDKVVSLRRAHEGSIRANLKTRSELKKGRFHSLWYTYLDIKTKASIQDKKFLLKECIDSIYIVKKQLAKKPSLFILEVFKTFKLKGIYFILFLISLRIDRAYYFRNKLMEQ